MNIHYFNNNKPNPDGSSNEPRLKGMNSLYDNPKSTRSFRQEVITERIIKWIIESNVHMHDEDEFLRSIANLEFLRYVPIEYFSEAFDVVDNIIDTLRTGKQGNLSC